MLNITFDHSSKSKVLKRSKKVAIGWIKLSTFRTTGSRSVSVSSFQSDQIQATLSYCWAEISLHQCDIVGYFKHYRSSLIRKQTRSLINLPQLYNSFSRIVRMMLKFQNFLLVPPSPHPACSYKDFNKKFKNTIHTKRVNLKNTLNCKFLKLYILVGFRKDLKSENSTEALTKVLSNIGTCLCWYRF